MTALIREAIESGEPTVLCAHRENIPDLQATALAALGVDPAADDDDGPFSRETRKEWDTPLHTGAFWVLNLEPAPSQPAAALARSADAPSAESSPATRPSADQIPAAVPPAPAWWRRLFGGDRGRNRPAAAGEVSEVSEVSGTADAAEAAADAAGASAEPDSDSGPRDARLLPAVLISADRYDLSEP
jgi:hypothetical protein